MLFLVSISESGWLATSAPGGALAGCPAEQGLEN
jgi:hypothetical protein